jgi:hypothetical protein
MSFYDKPKSDSLIYNDDNYTSLEEDMIIQDIDLKQYLQKSGGVMTGSLSTPSISVYNSGNIEFQTNTGNKIFNKNHVIDIENNKLQVQNIISDTNSTTINNDLIVDKIKFPDLTEQITGFNHIGEINASTYKLTQVSYDNGLLRTTFNNSVLINNLTCNNINTSHLNTTTSNLQSQLNLTNLQLSGKQNSISALARLNCNLIGTGTISNTVLNYLTGVTSSIQPQINNKQDIINASNKMNCEFLASGNVTNTMYDYLTGVTSNIQTQFNNLVGKSTNDILYYNNAAFTDLETNNVLHAYMPSVGL